MKYYNNNEVKNVSLGIKAYVGMLFLGVIIGGLISWAIRAQTLTPLYITLSISIVIAYSLNSSSQRHFKWLRKAIYESMKSESPSLDFYSFSLDSCFGLDVDKKQFIYTRIDKNKKIDTIILSIDDIKSIGYKCEEATQWVSNKLNPSLGNMIELKKMNENGERIASFSRGIIINFKDVVSDPIFIIIHKHGIDKWSNIIEELFNDNLTARDEPYRIS